MRSCECCWPLQFVTTSQGGRNQTVQTFFHVSFVAKSYIGKKVWKWTERWVFYHYIIVDQSVTRHLVYWIILIRPIISPSVSQSASIIVWFAGSSAAYRASLPGHSVQHDTQEPQQTEVPSHGSQCAGDPGQEDGPRHDGWRARHAAHPSILRRARPQGPRGEAANLDDGEDGEVHDVRRPSGEVSEADN